MDILDVFAWIIIISFAANCLPGSSLKRKLELKEFAWDGPHVYFQMARGLAGLALAIGVLVT